MIIEKNNSWVKEKGLIMGLDVKVNLPGMY